MEFVSNLAIAFGQVCEQHPDRIALRYPDGRLVPYSELAQLVNEVAVDLFARGLRQGHVLAIFHDKSPLAFATMLACLRLGVAYSTLDPESPWTRLEKILGTLKPKLVVCTFADIPHHDELTRAGLPVAQLTPQEHTDSQSVLPSPALISGGAPAYIMFTSGSTGVPKGAVISHANVLWFVQWSRARFGITPDDVLTNVNPIYFDNSVFDFYSAIFAGATLVPFSATEVRDARAMIRSAGECGCTIWFSVPSLLVYLLTTRALTPDDLPHIRKIIFGGEGFPKSKLKQLFDMFGSKAQLENVYGPTECTCICSAYTVQGSDFVDMQNLAPLGKLAQNFDYEILAVDEGDPDFGELFLRGPHVGLGYYNDPERTARAFDQNPTHQRHADIGYKTGDLVRRDAAGDLHFKGRADFQIKHMGYRIELEEIEAALSPIPGIRECAVIYLPDGFGEIVACCAVDPIITSEHILLDLGRRLPAYMVPRRVVLMPLLPKNANGKIDRVALKALKPSP